MPVVQLQDDSGANLGSALGAVGGYLATQKARKADKVQAQADKAHTTAREDQEAADRGEQIRSQIAERTASADKTKTDQAHNDVQQSLFQKYSALVQSGPPKGADPKQWAASLQSQAAADGFTDTNLRNQVIGNAQAVIQSRAPKLKDVEQGLTQLPVAKAPGKNGKGGVAGATPQQISQHYMDAASRVIQSDLPDDQKKLAAENFQRLAADALKGQPKQAAPMTDYQRQELDLRRQALDKPRVGGAPRDASGLTPGEALTNKHWWLEHNPDGSPKYAAPHDLSGMNAAGRQDYQHDLTTWSIGGMDPNAMPNPNDPKYSKRTSGGAAPVSAGGGASGTAATGGGEKKTVSLKAAMALPNNKGKTSAQVQADIAAHGYSVAP